MRCQINAKMLYPTGKLKEEIGDAIVEVVEIKNKKFISITSAIDIANNLTIDSLSEKIGDRAFDSSDKNKWYLTKEVKNPDDKIRQSFYIDRNNGKIIVKHIDFILDIEIDINGVCEKINTNLKRF